MVTDDSVWVAAVNPKRAALVSTRVGNYQSNPQLGPLLDQMWFGSRRSPRVKQRTRLPIAARRCPLDRTSSGRE
jgi:hypothetical protein